MSREFRDMLCKGGPFEADADDELEQKARGKGMVPRGGSGPVALRLRNRLALGGRSGNFASGKGRQRSRNSAAALMQKLKKRRGVAAHIGDRVGVGESYIRRETYNR